MVAGTRWVVFAAGGSIETALLPYRLLYFRADYAVALSAAVSPGALDFVTRTALAAVTGDAVYDADTRFDQCSTRPVHLALSEADRLVIYPATARILAQCALGEVTCPVTRLFAFTPKDRVVIAPALHARMDGRLYAGHVDRLRSIGCAVLGDPAFTTTWLDVEEHLAARLDLEKATSGGTVHLDELVRRASRAP
jgi:phosphopantothenoylcysteine synthetase/decarboxylase